MIAVHPGLAARAPGVVQFLEKRDFNVESQIALESGIEEIEATFDDLCGASGAIERIGWHLTRSAGGFIV